MKYRFFPALLTLCILPAAVAQTVRFRTSLGDMDVTLAPSAKLTVANFLKYVNRGSYDKSFFHRSVRSFVIQGGGFQYLDGTYPAIPADGTVPNEFSLSNVRGTIAMAKLGDDPNSATTQWFFNLADNAGSLNGPTNGGYTVFGRVVNNGSYSVMDSIARVPVVDKGSPFNELPLRDYTGGAYTDAHLVMIDAIEMVPSVFQNGVTSAGAFGALPFAAPGSFIEIYGTSLASGSRGWAEADFSEGKAPTTLDRVTVTINGEPAYVSYVSLGQINAQVPANVPAGQTVPVVVSYGKTSSPPIQLAIRATAPGLLAPRSFKVGDKQYVAAVHHTTGAFVSNGSIPDVPAAPAKAGETLHFYGIGFGALEPGGTPVAGQTAQGLNRLVAPVEFFFGDAKGQVLYAGLTPGFVGVYQFDVTLPANLSTGDVPLRVTLGGENISQTLFLPVGN